MIITKQKLEIALSKLKSFSSPSMELEQYSLDGKTASDMLWFAYQLGDIENKVIADLGSGTGLIGIGALLLGAKKVYFLDKSEAATRIAKENLQNIENEFDLELKNKSLFLVGDVNDFGTKVQIVMQNPPFGTKTEHIDRVFLEKAMEIAGKIYSLHKTSTMDYLKGFALKKSFDVTHQLRIEFPLKQTMKFHKQPIKLIDVTLIRLAKEKKMRFSNFQNSLIPKDLKAKKRN